MTRSITLRAATPTTCRQRMGREVGEALMTIYLMLDGANDDFHDGPRAHSRLSNHTRTIQHEHSHRVV